VAAKEEEEEEEDIKEVSRSEDMLAAYTIACPTLVAVAAVGGVGLNDPHRDCSRSHHVVWL